MPNAARRSAAGRAQRLMCSCVTSAPAWQRSLAQRHRGTPLRDERRTALTSEGVMGDNAIGLPAPQGLFDPALDKDSCGVGFIADIKGRKSHQIVDDALAILCNLEHRGAVGADPRAGDGAGILVQIPHAFFARTTEKLGFKLPKPGEYAIGVLFMPRDSDWRHIIRDIYSQAIKREGMTLLGWRDVPTDNSTLGETVKPTEPVHQQVFIGRGKKIKSDDEF